MLNYTYIAGDWEHDIDVVQKLYSWNNSPLSPVSFINAHDITQARDDSLNCSIKKSLMKRLSSSNKFILIVGNHTKSLTSGGCQFCNSYSSYHKCCRRGNSCDYRSYIQYECDKAMELMLDILILYNSSEVNHSLCPSNLSTYRDAWHIPLYSYVSLKPLGAKQSLSTFSDFLMRKKVYNQKSIANFLAQ